jgi:hypothetical protein
LGVGVSGKPLNPFINVQKFSRYGYTDLTDLKDTIGRIQSAQIPLDVIFVDIDYMERYKDFTTGQEVSVLFIKTKNFSRNGENSTIT